MTDDRALKKNPTGALAADDPAGERKRPRTERGRKTMRAILDAAAREFGEKGFHDASITGITQNAGVALGSFYTYFDSKDAVFRALVQDLSEQVRDHVTPAVRAESNQIAAERAALLAFLEFVREHKEIYRIIDEAEFVDPERFRAHYSNTATRIAAPAGRRRTRRGARGCFGHPCVGDYGHERIPWHALLRLGRRRPSRPDRRHCRRFPLPRLGETRLIANGAR